MLSAVSETVSTMPDGPRYDDDFFAWTRHQQDWYPEPPREEP
jgi:hypothetical protein